MRRDAEVVPKYLLRSLVIRKKEDSLERALEAKERGRGKKGEKKEKRKQGEKKEKRKKGKKESGHGGLHHHSIVTEQCS